MPTLLEHLPIQKFDDWAVMGLHAVVYLLGAWLLTFMLSLFFRRLNRLGSHLIGERGGQADGELEKQTRTITSILRRVLSSLIWGLAVVLALKEFHFDVGPILAGAGVAGLAVGFAAQSVLKDWISGFFLLTEGRIRINDVVRIGDVTGNVEQLSLRTTVLRGNDGAVYVYSNGTLQNFTNLTLGHAYAVFDLAADPEDDPERLLAVLGEIGDELRKDARFSAMILDAMETGGIERFSEQGIVLKARMKTAPNRQWDVAREVYRRLRQKCAERGISIATARRAVVSIRKERDHEVR